MGVGGGGWALAIRNKLLRGVKSRLIGQELLLAVYKKIPFFAHVLDVDKFAVRCGSA